MSTFPERLAQAAIAYHEVGQYGDAPEVRITARSSTGHYTYDPERGGYWVLAQAFVPESEIDDLFVPAYSVWECEDFSNEGDWSDVSEWQLHDTFQCYDDDSGARRMAHDRARALRKGYGEKPRVVVAVRPGNEPPRLYPTPAPASAGENR